MRWLRLLLVVPLVLIGCARFNSVGWVDLPGGYRLKAMTLQVDTVIGTDITYGIVYECAPAPEKKSLKEKITGKVKPQCVKVGEFGGSSPSFPKALFGNAAAAAAIGTGIALQDYEGDSVSVSGTSSSSSRSKASATSKARSSSKARGGDATVNMPMMPMGGGGD